MLSRYFNLCIGIILVVGSSGCMEMRRAIHYGTKSVPDEFQVETKTPLEIPKRLNLPIANISTQLQSYPPNSSMHAYQIVIRGDLKYPVNSSSTQQFLCAVGMTEDNISNDVRFLIESEVLSKENLASLIIPWYNTQNVTVIDAEKEAQRLQRN